MIYSIEKTEQFIIININVEIVVIVSIEFTTNRIDEEPNWNKNFVSSNYRNHQNIHNYHFMVLLILLLRLLLIV